MAPSTEITLDCLPPSLLQGQQVMQEENIIVWDGQCSFITDVNVTMT